MNAIADACAGSNPRQPSVEEMEKLLKRCYMTRLWISDSCRYIGTGDACPDILWGNMAHHKEATKKRKV